MSEAFAGQVVVIRRNPVLLGLAASPLLGMLVSLVAALVYRPEALAFAFPSLMLGMLTLGAAVVVNPWPRRTPVALEADDEGLRTNGNPFLRRSDIKEALVIPDRGNGSRVALRCRRSLGLELAVRSDGDGRRLLRAIGLDTSHAIVSFFGMSRVYARARNFFLNLAVMVVGSALFGFLANFFHARAFLAGTALAFIGAYISFFMPGRIKVGADGVVVSWYGIKRFVGYGDGDDMMAYARPFGMTEIRGVSLRLKSGEEIRVPLGYGYWDSGRSHIVAERIAEAMDTYRRGGTGSDAAMLNRGSRTVSEWVLALRQIGSGASAGPRTAAVAHDTLWWIVEDPSSASTRRAAAAVALGAEIDDDGRARLKGVANATAAPKLRVAIEAVSRGDDAGLVSALEELEMAEADAAEKSA